MQIRNMLHVFALVFFSRCSVVRTESKLTALRFGQTKNDYIEFESVDISQGTTNFSVCTWLRNRLHGGYPQDYPVMLHYTGYYSYGFKFGSNGEYNEVVGSNFKLKDKFNIPQNQWFHVCWTWSNSYYTTLVYLNGELIGSGVTEQRELRSGGKMTLGHLASDTRYDYYFFGGDMFKLDIYSKVLHQSEIKSMSSDFCSFTEKRLTSSRIVRWEDIVMKKRSGNVTEIPTNCYEYENDSLLALIRDNGDKLENNGNLSRLYLTVTIVFGALSTALLIILIIVARKFVAANRTPQPVLMSNVQDNQ